MIMQLTPPTNYSIANNGRLPYSQTTQLKATAIQRNGNGLTEAEQAIVARMRLLEASVQEFESLIMESIQQGGNPDRLRTGHTKQFNQLGILKLDYPHLVSRAFPDAVKRYAAISDGWAALGQLMPNFNRGDIIIPIDNKK